MSLNTNYKNSSYSRGGSIGSYLLDIANYINEFNSKTQGVFEADNRILIPSKNPYELDKRGIIIEYQGKDFDTDFDKYYSNILELANKLDKRSSLYEYPFKEEFCNKDSWVEWSGKKVAYNFNL